MSRMKHLLRKLHIGGSVNDHQRLQETRHNSPSPSSTTTTTSSSGSSSASSSSVASPALSSAPRARAGADSATETRRNGGDESVDFNFFEEEFQVQLALAISASDPDATKDPESVQIDAAKRISLGCSAGTSADALVDFLSLRYWNYNVVNYDEKVADGFYDVYGIISNANLHGKMPSLVDLQAISISDSVDYEVVLVNRTVDPELQQLERKADSIAVECQAAELGPFMSGLVQKIADLVVDSMGGPVGDADEMLRRWTARSYELRTSLNTIVLPLGCLRVGLSRHRALLFKVLADQINLPCRLVKGSYYTGTDEGAVNLIKIDQQSEYIIDLMGAPGTLIPAEMPSGNLGISAHDVMNSSAIAQTVKDLCVALDKKVNCEHEKSTGRLEGSSCETSYVTKGAGSGLGEASGNDINLAERNQTARFEHEFGKLLPSLGRPPRGGSSGTKEISSPAQKMKVKDVSKYVISAAQNPEFAQKLHAVLLESGASPPPDLFSDINSPQDLADAKVVRQTYFTESNMDKESRIEHSLVPFTGLKSSSLLDCENKRKRCANEMTQNQGFEKLSPNSSSIDNPSFGNSDTRFPADHRSTSPITSLPFTCSIEWLPHGGPKNLGVTDSTPIVDSSFVIPREYGQHARETFMHVTAENAGKITKYPEIKEIDCTQTCQESINESMGKPVEIDNDRQLVASGSCTDRMDPLLDDVAEWEIPWEDLQLGERIGLGSFGEVYRADWNGTEVAVKKFLDQDFSGDALEQFRCEIKIMLRLRHPNVVLFMGAVTRPPNLSILTEFLPRGSLYRLLHRPNIQLDEKRRLRMALDVAKGMNYLHTSHPTIVHRDLKSPNLLVDKNWVVKVCDFGLSRLKHHTFLSSKSTAGTPEWMAPEVLRNEPSNEKCDVYSFGVILWELTTLRMPWSGMNPMQVVGAVGFQNRRLDIPNEVDPGVAQIISDCWQSDPTLRPSFAQLMAPLKHLRRLVVEVT